MKSRAILLMVVGGLIGLVWRSGLVGHHATRCGYHHELNNDHHASDHQYNDSDTHRFPRHTRRLSGCDRHSEMHVSRRGRIQGGVPARHV